MSAPDRLVGVVARLLPPPVRARYREEWTAELVGARDAGLAPGSILLGALAVVATIDRRDPRISGMPVRDLAIRRARWGLAVVGVAALLGGGLWLSGLLGGSVARVAAVVLAIALAAGAATLLGAFVTAVRLPRPAALAVGLALAVAGVAALAVLATSVVLIVMFLPVAAVGAAFVVLALVPTAGSGAPRTAAGHPAPRRVAIAAGTVAVVAAIVGLGILHVTVWNPLAKLPGMTLDEIYAGLAAAGESPSPVLLVLWAGGALASAVAVAVFALLPERMVGTRRSPRRLFVLGLAAVAGTGLSVVMAGFGMGMSIADAFGTDGGDAGPVGSAIVLVGLAAAIPGVLLATVPGPRPAAAP